MHDSRWPVVAALLAISALAWGYTYWLATGFDMSGMMSAQFVPWTPVYFAFMLVMWVVMMVGMMTPTVAPTVLLFAELGRRQGSQFPSVVWFVAGYLLAWSAFALCATLLQWLLEWRALIIPMMAGTSRALGGAVLAAAGVYQWLPVKQACLVQCRAPLSFIQRKGGFPSHSRDAIRLGWLHGLYCVGCCWAVMALLFAFGVMNLYWIAGLMVFVLLEKIVPYPGVFSRVAGLVALAVGAALISTTALP